MVTRMVSALCALACAFVAGPGPARADAWEASLDVRPLGGLAVLGDDAAPGQVQRSYLAGGAARMTYATRDLFAYEAELAVARSGLATYERVAWDEEMGELERITELARAQVGVRLRLGARFIPTVHVAVGGQARVPVPSRLLLADGSVIEGPNAPWSWALTVSGGLGFDYRINARWVAGVAVSAIQAFPLQAFPLGGARFQSLEGGLHVSYVWYPHW
jgi:hypothetical protein